MSSSSSPSPSPPVVPQHCSTVPVLYELLKGEEEPCRMWLRHEINQIADPLIDSIFHGLIMSSSSSSSAIPQSRLTVSEVCELLKGEKVESSRVLKGEMDRLLNTLFERLTNKLMANTTGLDRSQDAGDRAQVVDTLNQVETPNSQTHQPSSLIPQPSTSTFNPVPHQQHSNGDEVQSNTVEMIHIKQEHLDEQSHNEQHQQMDSDDADTNAHNVTVNIKTEPMDCDFEDCELLSNPSRDSQNASNANESIEEDGTNLSSELPNISNLSDGQTVTRSGGDLLSPSTSTGLGSNRTALNQQATASTGRNATKRKQPTSNRSAKRSKKTLQNDDGEDGEDIANEDRKETKVKMLCLNCTQSNCNVKLDSLDHLYVHLSTVHQHAPLRCFATDCNARFDNPRQIRDHIKEHHSSDTRFLCAICSKEYDSQKKANKHWYQNHLTGQFKCSFVSDCGEVSDTRDKMSTHQQVKHQYQSKHLHCTQPGCTASFAFKVHLKQHELTHLDSQPFHCSWLQCNHRTNRRASLVTHIRSQHFGLPKSMKEQMAKNIVDLRDPNEYVRVVVDE